MCQVSTGGIAQHCGTDNELLLMNSHFLWPCQALALLVGQEPVNLGGGGKLPVEPVPPVPVPVSLALCSSMAGSGLRNPQLGWNRDGRREQLSVKKEGALKIPKRTRTTESPCSSTDPALWCSGSHLAPPKPPCTIPWWWGTGYPNLSGITLKPHTVLMARDGAPKPP